MRTFTAEAQRWPIAGGFAISRGAKSVAEVVVARLGEGEAEGRGECVPYGRYGESVDSVLARLEEVRPILERGADRPSLRAALPPGAARNAADAALWDLEAKRTGRRVWEIAGLAPPPAAVCAYTLSLAEPAAMAAEAARVERPLLKLKLGGSGDAARVEAVREAAPGATIIVDANEGWSPASYRELAPRLAGLGVAMIEQPLPAGEDGPLADLERPVPVCADESVHGVDSLPDVVDRYDMVNIKLDKTGGLTEALDLRTEAARAGLDFMVGCMVSTSLAMAPAALLIAGAAFVDLDGPLLLVDDRRPGLRYEHGKVWPPEPELWG